MENKETLSASFLLCPLCHVVRPHFTLTDDRADGGVVVLRRVLVLFQQVLDHFLHGGAGGGFLLPVNGAVFAEHLGQLPGQVDQLVVNDINSEQTNQSLRLTL